LIVDGKKLIPAVMSTLKRRGALVALVHAYGQGAPASLRATLSILRDRERVFELSPVLVDSIVSGSTKTTRIVFNGLLSDLPCGRYSCEVEVTVLDSARNLMSRWREPIVLEE
jgi:hypothetical protein